jgi:hypothetical protein
MKKKSTWLLPLLGGIAFLAFFIHSNYRAHFLYPERTDLLICWNAAQNLWNGNPVYVESDLWAHTKPPFATLMFLPLTKIDFTVLATLWDTLNILLLFVLTFLICFDLQGRFRQSLYWTTLVGVLSVMNFWGYELRFGQYNVLTLFFVYIAAKSKNSRIQASFFWVAFFLKPSNLLFLPLILKNTKLRSFVNSSLGVMLFFAVLYSALFGLKALWVDHFAWLDFMKFATKKYLMREVNYGLPTLIGYLTTASWPQHLLLFASLLWGFHLIKKVSHDIYLFGLLAVLSLVVSPMTWWATFTMALPLHIYLLLRAWECIRSHQLVRGVLLLVAVYSATQLIFPNFLPDFIMLNVPRLANPNWVYLAILLYVSFSKYRPETDYRSGLIYRK